MCFLAFLYYFFEENSFSLFRLCLGNKKRYLQPLLMIILKQAQYVKRIPGQISKLFYLLTIRFEKEFKTCNLYYGCTISHVSNFKLSVMVVLYKVM